MSYKGFDLTDTVALVTGGSRGLGRAIAEGLAEAGAQIAITARREKKLHETRDDFRDAGLKVCARTCDITEPDSVHELINYVESELGVIEVLVNNAGTSWAAPTEDMPLDRWEQVLEVNLTGMFIVTQRVGREMIRNNSGSIINISSIAGLRGMDPQLLQTIGYNTTKGGILSFTTDLAAKWAQYGIRVNALAPNFFPTRMSREVIDQNRAFIQSRTPLEQVGSLEEIKGPAIFFASQASSYITGQVLPVDGGYSTT